MNKKSCELIVRARPNLGTIVRIEARGVSQDLVTGAFEEVARLERIFNFHDPASVLSQFNDSSEARRNLILESQTELRELLKTCERLAGMSSGYFHPVRAGRFDLSGIAKGYIVDKTVEWILARAESANGSTVDGSIVDGSINAGGDIRFFSSSRASSHSSEHSVVLRLGTSQRAISRELKLSRACVATSAPFAFNDRVYFEQAPRAHSVVVQADCAAIADGLTKVALFAPREKLEACCEQWSAVAILFDENGELVA